MKHPFLAFVLGTATLLSGTGLHAASNYATPYTFTTLAGGRSATSGAASGIVVDGKGNLYVADKSNYIISKIDTNGNVTTVAGQTGVQGSDDGNGTNATFNVPYGIVVDGKGNLFIADNGNNNIRKIDTNGNVTTLAGGKISTQQIIVQGQSIEITNASGYQDGQGTNSDFNGPSGIAMDGKGNLFVADTGNSTIRKIDTNGNVTTLAGQVGVQGNDDGNGTNATFGSPDGIAVDEKGNLFVADPLFYTIRKIDTNGNVTTVAGQAWVTGSSDGKGTNATFNVPYGIVVDGKGNLLVTDSGNNTIRKIDANGNVMTIAGQVGVTGSSDGKGTNATFNGPDGIAVDGKGNLLVTDNSTIRKIDATGNVTTKQATFNSPQGLALDGGGNLFVADTGNNIIRKIDVNGNVMTIAGQVGVTGSSDGKGTNATFNGPWGIAVDGKGNLFVTDSQNDTIRKIDAKGNVSTIAGAAGVQGSDDGQGSNAFFDRPRGIAVDIAGNLYVADSLNCSFRKIDATGNVTTIVGSMGNGTDQIFFSPAGIAVDATGNLFLLDAGSSTLRTIQNGHIVSAIGGFNVPGGLAVKSNLPSPYDTIFVADTWNNTIEIELGGVRTIAGQAGVSGSKDGTGSDALFTHPSAITVDGKGNLYVADTGNNLIRKGVPPSPQTIKFEAIPKKVYGTPSFNLTATAISGLPVSFSSANSNVATVFSNTVTIVGAGTTTITATQSGNGSYLAATPVTNTLIVTPATQTITLPVIPAHTYGDPAFPLTAMVSPSTNQTITYASSKTNVATVSGNNLTIIGAGVTTITASVTAPNYTPATTSRVLTVNKAAQTISFSTPSSEAFVKGSTFTLTSKAPGGTVSFKSSNPKVISITGTTAMIQGTGKATITASCTASANYQGSTPVAIAVTVQ